ncbi:MAG: hypothetical protein WC393_00120 [Candidatus Nanoarchaeia archaeon]
MEKIYLNNINIENVDEVSFSDNFSNLIIKYKNTGDWFVVVDMYGNKFHITIINEFSESLKNHEEFADTVPIRKSIRENNGGNLNTLNFLISKLPKK